MTPRAVVIVVYLAFLVLLSSLCQLFTAAAISAGLLRPHSSRKILSVSLFQVFIDDRAVFYLSLDDYILLRIRPTVCVIRMFLCGTWHQRILEGDTAAGTLKGRER